MSTDLEADPAARRPIASVEELRGWFASGNKPRSRWGIGLEYERLGVFTESGQAVPYAGPRSIRALFAALVERRGYTPHLEGETPIALSRGSSWVTLEPGGQTELSGGIHTRLDAMHDEVCAFVRDLNEEGQTLGISWVGLGLQPFSERDAIAWVPKRRYAVMSAHLGRTGRLALDMMKRTAGVQINLDWSDEEDAAQKFRTLMGISPVVTALFANSPLDGGRPSGLLSTRAAIWRDTDPARCGLLRLAFADRPLFAAYLDYALDVPAMFAVRDGKWHPIGVPFRQFIKEGFGGLTAEYEDWRLHLTTLFPDVRLKTFMEFRPADSGDASLAMAQAALIQGIVYDTAACQEAWDLVAGLSFAERELLHAEVPRLGLAARAGAFEIAPAARALVEIAAGGLARQSGSGVASQDAAYLDPLRAILAKGETPAQRVLRLWEGRFARDPRRLVEDLARVHLDCPTC